MDRQAFFDLGVTHVLRTGPASRTTEWFPPMRPDTEPTVACFLGDDGAACFLGANLLESLSARSVRSLENMSQSVVYTALGANDEMDQKFVDACQAAHDDAFAETDRGNTPAFRLRFRKECRKIARTWNLSMDSLRR